ncbi:right-handed parallel beta-helix repeat-containing protein [Streptomyces sp. NBC_00872]|uniref:right-handed parallel beta-helix repeat-containing protein n=1 Tax=Streptomyces sp. NBC_00872 TaxID=2903686 RepID=UPI00386DFCA0|nr:right-handed parallel beta-helix repeat-containing protein [Streptomyces sp. NBC_00872]
MTHQHRRFSWRNLRTTRTARTAPTERATRTARTARTARGARLAAVLPLAVALFVAAPAPASFAAPGDGGDGKDGGQVTTAEDAENETALVAAEDHRLDQVRAVAAVAPLKGDKWTRPYRLETAGGYTLVFTPRTQPYGVADLLKFAPQTFVRSKRDGSYLLTENIYLLAGAKLKLSSPGGLTLRLASNSRGFVSIVSFGGRLTLEGTPQAPMRISSWDPSANKPDTDVRDGRAYVRAIGGQFSMTHAQVSDLGFWSGRTGGLSLTGTDRPDTGNIKYDDGEQDLNRRELAAADDKAEQESEQTPHAGGVIAQPAGELATPDSRFSVPDLSYVSAEITNSTISGNLYGLFLSGATGANIIRTKVINNLEDGVVLHRGVTNVVVDRTVSQGNGGDGFVLSRATQQVRVTGSKALSNGGNGFTLSGRPLANGPSASGESISSYGSNSVSDSTARDNGRYGIEVFGGENVGVQNNEVDGGDMGIVAREDATKVAITGNHLTGQTRQGISVRDGVSAATVTGNIIEGTETGVYVRDSQAEVRGNTVQEATNHGISLVGDIDKSTVSYNVVAGVGPSAVDTSRAHGGVTVKENQTFAWHDTSAFWVKFKHYASPMTLLWVSILLLILFSALLGARRSSRRGGVERLGVHPYADKKPLPSAPATEVGNAASNGNRPTGRHRVPAMTAGPGPT